MANYIPDHKLEIIVDLLSDGCSQRNVAKAAGVSKGTVRRIYQIINEGAGELDYTQLSRRKGGYHDQKTHGNQYYLKRVNL